MRSRLVDNRKLTHSLGRFLVFFKFFSYFVIFFILGACATTAKKDPVSIQNIIALKAESLVLLEKATEPPEAHASEIEGLRKKLQGAIEYEKSKGEINRVSVKQWELLANPQGNLLGGFLRKWETDGTGQSQAFIDGVKGLVTNAFDEILQVEHAKP